MPHVLAIIAGLLFVVILVIVLLEIRRDIDSQ